jgi:hypothetical protein
MWQMLDGIFYESFRKRLGNDPVSPATIFTDRGSVYCRSTKGEETEGPLKVFVCYDCPDVTKND